MKTKILLFGITGDLSRKKLLPALETIIDAKIIDDVEIIGVSRRKFNPIDILAKSNVKDHNILLNIISSYTMNLDKYDDYLTLKNHLNLGDDEQLLIYLSVPPNSAITITEFIGKAGLNTPNVKILLEKPFGYDLESAKDFLGKIAHFFKEEQVYRIDHYLAKPSIEKIISIKKKSALSAKWNNKFIKNIDIIGVENIGIEGRSIFYEQTGALRDFVQNHLMVLLTLVITNTYDYSSLPNDRYLALKNIVLKDVEQDAIRGQYHTYKNEVLNEASFVETAAILKLESTDVNWTNIPIRLISAKNNEKKFTFIRIYFKDGNELEIDVNESNFAHINNKTYNINAYENVFINAINNNRTWFISANEIIRSWEIVQPVLNHWKTNHGDLKIYPAGSDVLKIVE